MKICSLSDIHGQFKDIPECDVLCIPGDIINLNDQRSIDASRHWWYNRFTNWVNRLPCKKVIITPGNHKLFLILYVI
ncbi:DNA double-strand break repair protein [uncultured phage cr125_1]|uniref:DNA double-strand break repair protein n=1 Tax=uncultured phage cr125_1 TaxID=2772091 RepID=A0A7M1RTC6_9CAUD|nr:DNA double-strand break repair protein [uncultured phage cr125_1]QOR57526.1 DNA double-strand break repair protein [uncultured phage cr125_1]DAW32056.1 MAG TPA: Metallophosphoesterase, calcineurin superfamily [Caudoviricetes sp.]